MVVVFCTNEMPRYKRLKKVNQKKGNGGKKSAVKDDIDAKKKKEDIKEYELKKLIWELRGGKLRYGRAAGRASGSSWIATQNKSEEAKIQRNAMQAVAKQQALEAVNTKDQLATYRTNVELEKGVGMQDDINSMKEKNKTMEYKLQQQRGTSASGQELMDEISKEHAAVKKQSDMWSDAVKKKQDIGKLQKKYEEDKEKLIGLVGGPDNLPVIDDEYVKKQTDAYNEAKKKQSNVTSAVNARKKALEKYDKEGRRLGIPDDDDFYKTKDLHKRESMIDDYLAKQVKTTQETEEILKDLKKSLANINKVREDKQKSIDEMQGQIAELYPDNGEFVKDIINDPRYTYDEKVGRIREMQSRKGLELVEKGTLYLAAVMAGEQNKQDEEHAAKLEKWVGRLHNEAVNDKRYNVEKIYQKGSEGFEREVDQFMQLVNPLYDGVGIDPQYRATREDAVAVLESINKEASELRDEDEMLNNA